MKKLNKKGLEWHFIILMLLGALVVLWAIFYFTSLGDQMKDAINNLFELF